MYLKHWKNLETTYKTESNYLPAKLTLPAYPTSSLLINVMLILFHKISVDLILRFPSLSRLTSVEPNPQSSFYFVRETERSSSHNKQATRNII